MAEPVPIRERSVEALNKGLNEGEFDIKEALLAQRILQERQRPPATKWPFLIAIIGAAVAASLVTATIVGLLKLT